MTRRRSRPRWRTYRTREARLRAGRHQSMAPNHSRSVPEPELERQGRRLASPSVPLLAAAATLFVLGVVLVIFTSSWALALGTVLIVLSLPVATVAVAAGMSGAVARWAARRKPFA